MAYIIKDKIKITKPILFLCGPYYNDKNKSDRRKILQKFLLNDVPKEEQKAGSASGKNNPRRCLPLIIDDFLTRENLGDASISIQLLEEIFAGIAYKTFIFLDTMSSAVELGLFANSSCNNSIYTLLPFEKDRNCGGIGVFVKDIVLDDNMHKVKTTYYHPQIERVAFSTDHVGEFFKFVKNELPETIKKDILEDFESNCKLEYDIDLQNADRFPENDFLINYQYNKKQNELNVFISVRLLFYIVSGIVYSEYGWNIRKEEYEFSDYNIKCTVANLKEAIRILIIKRCLIGVNCKTQINIYTVLARNIEDIVKHIVAFIFTYHKNSRLRGYYFVCKNEVVKDLDVGMSPVDFFKLNAEDAEVITKANVAQGDYFRSFEIKNGKKKRQIITYQDNLEGRKMRELHKKLVSALEQEYIFNQHSYAYQKGKSVKTCVEAHKYGNSFLKYDVHKFFNSISKKKLAVKLMQEFGINKIYEEQMMQILNTCFVDDMMPIGLVTSPILSDLYMKEFDEEFANELGEGYVCTRYADDILISSTKEISEEEKDRINNLLQRKLRKLGLMLNEKKFVERNLTVQGQHVKYLGINIVKSEHANAISVGKTYKNYIAKCYLKYISMQEEENSKEKFYFGKQIAGYLSFVKMIEGEAGLKKIYTRIEKSTA